MNIVPALKHFSYERLIYVRYKLVEWETSYSKTNDCKATDAGTPPIKMVANYTPLPARDKMA